MNMVKEVAAGRYKGSLASALTVCYDELLPQIHIHEKFYTTTHCKFVLRFFIRYGS